MIEVGTKYVDPNGDIWEVMRRTCSLSTISYEIRDLSGTWMITSEQSLKANYKQL